MARMSSTLPRRLLATVLGAVACTAVGTSGLLLASSASATSGPTTERVVTCESGTVTSNGTETASAVVVRLPGGAPTASDCREG